MALTNPPDHNQPVIQPASGLVHPDWYTWFLALVLFSQQLAQIADDLDGSLSDLETQLENTLVTDCWAHFVPYVENGTSVVVPVPPFAGTITGLYVYAASGSCSVQFRRASSNVGSAMTANSSGSSQNVSVAFSTGQTIYYVISSNSNCTGLRIQITYTRSLL